MNKSELTEKLSAFWNETLTGDGKQFNFSVQDIIELYCEVRAREDELSVRKEQQLLGGKKSLAEVRLKNVKSLKFALLETFNVLTGDESGVAKLECWYSKFKQRCREPEPKVKVTESPKKVKDTTAKTYIGLPKSKEFLALNSQLHHEGVWNGNIKKTEIPEENLRSFYYVLGCDEEILLKMKETGSQGFNPENRLSSLVKCRLHLQEYFRFNFQTDPGVEFLLWKASVRKSFAKELQSIEKALKEARSEATFSEAYGRLVSFWSKFSF